MTRIPRNPPMKTASFLSGTRARGSMRAIEATSRRTCEREHLPPDAPWRTDDGGSTGPSARSMTRSTHSSTPCRPSRRGLDDGLLPFRQRLRLGEHGLSGKTYPYTESIRIPFYWWWPGRVATGSTDHRLISQVDIAPTVLVAAGVTPDPNYPIDGRSLSEPSSRARSLTEYWTSSDDRSVSPTPVWASLRTSQYQYVEYYASDEQTVTFREYYDLVGDRWQLTNLLNAGTLRTIPTSPCSRRNCRSPARARGRPDPPRVPDAGLEPCWRRASSVAR